MRGVVLILVALCALLSSCASSSWQPAVAPDYKLDPAGKTGVVVGSITYDSALGLYSVAWGAGADDRGYSGNVGWSMWPPLGPVYDDDLKAKGGTFAVEVPPGQYTLRRWSVRQGRMVFSAARLIGIPFTVEAGKVTYLGNFHFHKSDEVSLEDRSSRDIPILKARFASVKSAEVGMSIAEGFSLQAIGGESIRTIDVPAFSPIYVVPVKR